MASKWTNAPPPLPPRAPSHRPHPDDGSFRIWDLRNFKSDASVAHFKWHSKQVTSIEWSYDDENVLAVASADNTATVWDLSLEEDEEAEVAALQAARDAAAAKAAGGGRRAAAAAAAALPLPSTKDARLRAIPPQLLFIHAGQQDVKEAHWHKQIPGVLITTAADGFNVV